MSGDTTWEDAECEARRVVARTLAALPPDLRAAAERLPVTYVPFPDEHMVEDGIADDTLGLFVGNDLASGAEGPVPLPAQILLFLENLWDYADGDWQVFREEVRTTYLHELGHYLGLGEDDLDERGLS